jgi:hypothetical protein
MVAMDAKLDALLQTVAILDPMLDKEGEKDYKNHHLGWSDYCKGLKEVAREVISIICAGNVTQVEKIEMFGGHKTVTDLANPSDQVERSKEFKLCDTAVRAKNSSVKHNKMHNEMYCEIYGVMYAEMYNKMCSTVFNRDRLQYLQVSQHPAVQRLRRETVQGTELGRAGGRGCQWPTSGCWWGTRWRRRWRSSTHSSSHTYRGQAE